MTQPGKQVRQCGDNWTHDFRGSDDVCRRCGHEKVAAKAVNPPQNGTPAMRSALRRAARARGR